VLLVGARCSAGNFKDEPRQGSSGKHFVDRFGGVGLGSAVIFAEESGDRGGNLVLKDV
jgi:hypothetical protein